MSALEEGVAQAAAEDVANGVSAPNAKPDPFDPVSLRINHANAPTAAVKKLVTTIHVRKPSKQAFVRVHPSEGYRVTTATIEMKDDNEIYLVAPSLVDALADEVSYMTLFTAIDRQGNLFLWPVKLPKDDGPVNSWNASAVAAAEHAMKNWVRVKANRANQAYDVDNVVANCAEPEWPDISFREILKTAFRDRYIGDLDHPLILKLQGRE